MIRQTWPSAVKHSAVAEPMAISALFSFLLEKGIKSGESEFGPCSKIAVVTDHIALAYGQRRWWSHHGGFSPSFALNTCFTKLYNTFHEVQIFYVEGECNPADGPSRDTTPSPYPSSSVISYNFPHLSSFFHPYATRDIPEHCV